MKLSTLAGAISLAIVISLHSLPGLAQNPRNSQPTQTLQQKPIKANQPSPTQSNTNQPSSAQSSTSNQTIWNAIVAALGIAAGAVITALASAYSARQKIREIELVYIQKLRENYLANARLYTDKVYVPISIALSKLSEQYLQFRNQIDFDSQTVDEKAAEAFHAACQEYYEQVFKLTERGADAFLTTDLENRLRSFTSFIKASQNAEKPVIKLVLRYQLKLPLLSNLFFHPSLEGEQGAEAIMDKGLSRLGRTIKSFSVDFLGIGFTFRVAETVKAPITSREFEDRMVSDVTTLKFLIKEVTLGAHVS